ncbi:MAG: TetR/AcrR family transcriptional regulator [Acetobacteraceae bacterium]|nr:TetR/AcrR family transcriptional regulator [Acetobacteraceae bacterium]
MSQPASPAAEPALSRAEATRARIEETAERLFRSMGYQKTAVADIARELGMSPANVYRFFPSKSAINEAIAERTLGALLAEVQAIANGPGTATARLRRLFSRTFEAKIEVFFQERRLHDMVTAAMEEHWGVIERHIQAVHGALAGVLAEGMAAGEFGRRDPAQEALRAMNAMWIWNHPALVENCIMRRGLSIEEMRGQVADMTEFILRALRP